MLKLISRFSTNKHIEYSRYFLLQYQYVPDAYYKSVFSMPKHKEWIKKFTNTNPVHVIGGQKFPMQGSYLIFNCQDENIPLRFVAEVEQCEYIGFFSERQNCNSTQLNRVDQNQQLKIQSFI